MTTAPFATGTADTTAERPLAEPTSGTDGWSLTVDHVTKRYGSRTVVDDLTFTVPAGRVTGFLGPNGSGKSTTLKIILDLAKADQGRASIGGHRYRDPAIRRERSGP